jgi:hypothetical protein
MSKIKKAVSSKKLILKSLNFLFILFFKIIIQVIVSKYFSKWLNLRPLGQQTLTCWLVTSFSAVRA